MRLNENADLVVEDTTRNDLVIVHAKNGLLTKKSCSGTPPLGMVLWMVLCSRSCQMFFTSSLRVKSGVSLSASLTLRQFSS